RRVARQHLPELIDGVQDVLDPTHLREAQAVQATHHLPALGRRAAGQRRHGLLQAADLGDLLGDHRRHAGGIRQAVQHVQHGAGHQPPPPNSDDSDPSWPGSPPVTVPSWSSSPPIFVVGSPRSGMFPSAEMASSAPETASMMPAASDNRPVSRPPKGSGGGGGGGLSRRTMAYSVWSGRSPRSRNHSDSMITNCTFVSPTMSATNVTGSPFAYGS